MATTKKTVREPAGIWKFPIDLSMVDACSTEKVNICAYVVQNIMVVAHIGSNLTIIFTSSTLVTELNFHGFGAQLLAFPSKSPSTAIAALSNKLYIYVQTTNKTNKDPIFGSQKIENFEIFIHVTNWNWSVCSILESSGEFSYSKLRLRGMVKFFFFTAADITWRIWTMGLPELFLYLYFLVPDKNIKMAENIETEQIP